MDYTRSPGATASPAIDPLFSCTPITNEAGQPDWPYYWTSTSHASNNGLAQTAAYVAFGRAMGCLTMPGSGGPGSGRRLVQAGPGKGPGGGGPGGPGGPGGGGPGGGGMGPGSGGGNSTTGGPGGGAGGMAGPGAGGQNSTTTTTTACTWMDIHGAGAQRSDPKAGDPATYRAQGQRGAMGGQTDAIRITNYVRLVRDV